MSALGEDVGHRLQIDAWKRVVRGDDVGMSDGALGTDSRRPVHTVITIEDDAGALNAFVAQRIADVCALSCGPTSTEREGSPLLLSQRVVGVGPSFRSLPACLDHFGFTAQNIQELYHARRAPLQL